MDGNVHVHKECHYPKINFPPTIIADTSKADPYIHRIRYPDNWQSPSQLSWWAMRAKFPSPYIFTIDEAKVLIGNHSSPKLSGMFDPADTTSTEGM